jgi:hypothetical protein
VLGSVDFVHGFLLESLEREANGEFCREDACGLESLVLDWTVMWLFFGVQGCCYA